MKILKLNLLLIIIIFISCSNDDDNVLLLYLEDTSDVLTTEEEQELINYPGTSCWIVRTSELKINTPITYEYRTNQDDTSDNYTVNWEITSGDIEVLSDLNTKTITIMLNGDFENAEIRVIGQPLACGMPLFISKK